MESTFQGNIRTTDRLIPLSFSRGLGWGLLGGLAGTITMDVVLMGALFGMGAPVFTCFSMVGNTMARFFSLQGLDMTRTIQLGVLVHYLIGPLIGVIFGTLVAGVKALRVNTLKKTILLAIVYVEILSQPLLVTTPFLLKMTAPQVLQWYGGSSVMHLIAGVVLGAVVGRGLRCERAN